MNVDMCGDWTAVLNLEPVGPPTLTVRGTACFNEGGWSAHLTQHAPPGINPAVLLLDLVVDGDEAAAHTEVLTEVPVKLVLETSTRYDQVEVLAPGGSRLIDVQIVQ